MDIIHKRTRHKRVFLHIACFDFPQAVNILTTDDWARVTCPYCLKEKLKRKQLSTNATEGE